MLGWDALRTPGARVQMAEDTLGAIRRIVPLPVGDALVARANAAVQAVGGALPFHPRGFDAIPVLQHRSGHLVERGFAVVRPPYASGALADNVGAATAQPRWLRAPRTTATCGAVPGRCPRTWRRSARWRSFGRTHQGSPVIRGAPAAQPVMARLKKKVQMPATVAQPPTSSMLRPPETRRVPLDLGVPRDDGEMRGMRRHEGEVEGSRRSRGAEAEVACAPAKRSAESVGRSVGRHCAVRGAHRCAVVSLGGCVAGWYSPAGPGSAVVTVSIPRSPG